ncbi:MAG: M56 family metallopeptidase [Terriglobales bacterium]|jgi:beta-lactamase regulating signal transducer with metallopeptidase domain
MNWFPLQTVAQISVERLLNALPVGFLIALFAWALLRVLRRQNSGTRFAVWFLALLTVAALPLLGGFGAGQRQALMTSGMSAPLSGSLRAAIAIPGRWALFVFLAWALGACVAMARLATGLWRLRQLRRSCTPVVAADLDPVVRKTVEAIGASKSVTVATSECVRVPAAIGFLKRTIVLPAWALRELPPEDLNVILLHEFAHLRRGDDWTNLIQKIVRALFFFHPAVWWIESRLSVEREMACDDAVLAETANPHGYATCLVSLLEKSLAHRLVDKRWSSSLAHAAVDRAREAALRLAQILDTKRPVATRVWKPALSMVAAFSVVCLMVLPHAPQFVAFDRTARVGTGALARPSRAQLGSNLRPQQTQIRYSEPPSVAATAKMKMAKAVHPRNASGNLLVPARIVAAPLNAEPPRDQVVAVSANADREIVPQFRTLVFIEATQYGTADSSVWSVQVWRVTWVSTVPAPLAAAPVANSI